MICRICKDEIMDNEDFLEDGNGESVHSYCKEMREMDSLGFDSDFESN